MFLEIRGKDKIIFAWYQYFLRFSPENAKGEKLTSRALKNECAFEFKDVLIRKEKTVEGKKKVYFEKIAVSDYALSQTETTPGGEG